MINRGFGISPWIVDRLKRVAVAAIPEGSRLPESVWRQRHLGILALLWLHAVGVFGLSLYTGQGVAHSLFEGGIIAAAALFAALPIGSRTVRAAIAGFGLIASSAVLVHLSGGYIEFHFHFFVMVGLMALYQEWIPFLLAIVFVLLHHGVVGVLDPSAVYNHPAAIGHPWRWAAIHAGFIAAMSVVSLLTWRLNEIASLEAERRFGETRTLLAVSQAAGAAIEPREALRRVTKLLVQALGADSGAVLQFDLIEDRVVPLAGYRIPKALLAIVSPSAPLSLAHPLFARIRRLNEPWCLPDSESDPAFQSDDAWARALVHKSMLVLPVRVKDEVHGAFVVAWTGARHAFTDDELRLAEGIARQAALGMENLGLLEGLQNHHRSLEALLEATRQLSSIQPLETVIQRITEACGRLLGTTSVGFRILEGDELVVAGTSGDAEEMMYTQRLKVGESVSGWVAKSGEPLVLRDVADDPRLIASHREPFRRAGYRGWLGMPVKVGGRTAGVLSIRTRAARGFTDADVSIASAFAAQAATALENARLYDEVRRAYEQLSRTQEQLTQAQKMEAIGRLAGGVAHDFNNLLTVITGRSDLLRRGVAHDAALVHHVELIEQTAERAGGLTAQLLAFSRKQMLQPKVLDLNGLVGHVSGMLRRLISEDIDFSTALGPALAAVKADPGQLEQVLMNLVVNARDAMPRGGHVTIETANVALDASYAARHADVHAGQYVMLAVSDTGSGMDAETQARVFEPFFTTKGPGTGTGLGLATVYGIVKQSGGHIAVYSELGHGTTFKIFLPAVDLPVEVGHDQHRLPPPPRGSETVLVVEDEEALRDLLAEVLEHSGYRVLKARDCTDAIKICTEREEPIHLLLTDVIMPQMSGRDLVQRVQPQRPAMKVLYMSGYTDGAIVHHGVLDPGIAFLQKPFAPRTVTQKIREVLDRPAASGAELVARASG